MAIHPLLEQADALAVQFLRPRAAQADRAAGPPVAQIQALAAAGLLGVTVPPEYGGAGGTPELVRDCVAAVASGCGVTAFVYFQHVVGCRHLAACANQPLRQELLPAFARGQRILSLAFSHLRRPGPPALQVRADGEDFLFNGVAPWMTGWGLADEVLLAGTLADGRSAWVIAPLTSSSALAASPPMALCAMNASATVSLICRDLRVGPERHVKTLAPAELAADTAGAILFFAALSLGVTRAAIDLVRDEGERRSNAAALRAAAALDDELTAARAAVNRCGTDLAETARVRACSIDLGVRAAHAAVAAGSGAANSLEHAAQRLFREAMVYTLIAQTRELQTATFERLIGRSLSD